MQVYNLEFSEQEVREAVAAGRLLSMEIEFSRLCNFRCSYCYVEDRASHPDELSREEIRSVLLQAKELGAQKIIILGGEPSIYPHLPEMLQFLADNGLAIEIFTNGSGVTAELAELLAQKRARVVLKLNSRDAELQDKLAGKKGAHAIIARALANLRSAGYSKNGLFLALSTVICRLNIDELPDLWRWLRREDIEPYFEVITPQANALANNWLNVTGPELKALFTELAAIDRKEFDRLWEPQPPLVGNRCMRHQVSCLVTARGEVMPCVGVTLAIGNIRKQALADILRHSSVLNDLKNYRETIKGPCKSCEKAAECYGCRGAAFQLTGDYLASDPTCWRNCGNQN
ncbi:MAG: radical SAM protein [Desulfobulbaceae bacterium]|nr:radical SAM protein [Desulfobulbaceae bacterium]